MATILSAVFIETVIFPTSISTWSETCTPSDLAQVDHKQSAMMLLSNLEFSLVCAELSIRILAPVQH